MAFNKDDELNMKYNVAVGQINKPAESKKRPYQEMSRGNPFKKEDVTPAEKQKIEVEAPKIIEETPTDVAQESAIEKEWKEIRLHNEKEKLSLMDSSTQFKNTEYPLKLN
jgi:hypothetical protein